MRCAEPNVFLGWCFEKSEIAVFRLGYEPLSTTGGIKGGTNRAASSSHKWGGDRGHRKRPRIAICVDIRVDMALCG